MTKTKIKNVYFLLMSLNNEENDLRMTSSIIFYICCFSFDIIQCLLRYTSNINFCSFYFVIQGIDNFLFLFILVTIELGIKFFLKKIPSRF